MNLKNRNIIVCLLLSMVTCGIYGIVWIWSMAKEAVSVKDPNEGTLEALLCLFFPFIGWFLVEKKFAEGCAAQGIEHKDNSILYLILGICCLSIVTCCLVQNDLNKLAPAAE